MAAKGKARAAAAKKLLAQEEKVARYAERGRRKSPSKNPHEVSKAVSRPMTAMITRMPLAKTKKAKKAKKAKKNIFPSKHPMVRNPDGTTSNVKMMTVEIDGKHYVLPSMVGGRQLNADAAVAHAKRLGLGKYPVFKTADEALKFSRERHADQPAPREGAGSKKK